MLEGRCFSHHCSWSKLSIIIDKKSQPKLSLGPAIATCSTRQAPWAFCPWHSQKSHKCLTQGIVIISGVLLLFTLFFFFKVGREIKGEKNSKEKFNCNFWSQITALGRPLSVFDFIRLKLNAFPLPPSEGYEQSHPAGCTVTVFRTERARHGCSPAWDAPIMMRQCHCLRLRIVIV